MPLRRYVEGDPIPGKTTWQAIIRRIRARAVTAVAPLYATAKRRSTELLYRPPARFQGVVTGAAGDGSYTVAEARFTPATGRWAVVAGGRVVTNAYEYNLSKIVTIGSAVEPRLSIAGDWRFYVPRSGVAKPPGCDVLPGIGVQVTDQCCSAPLGTFTITYAGSVVASCSTFNTSGVVLT